MHWLSQQLSWHSLFSLVLQFSQSMAWPLTVITLAVLFRLEVRQVIGRLAHLKFRDFEAEFRDELHIAEALKPKLEGQAAAPPRTRLEMYLGEQGHGETPTPPLSPRETIRRAWHALERTFDRHPPHSLVETGSLDGSELVQYERLRSLARMVERYPDWHPARADAERFRVLAARLSSRTSHG